MEVSCSFDSSVVLGYSVMLQWYAGSFDVVTKETREVLSPVIFDGLYAGLFSVTVFPLTDNGLIGTSVVYIAQVMVTAPTSTTPSPFTTPFVAAGVYYISIHVYSYSSCLFTYAEGDSSFVILIVVVGEEYIMFSYM